MITSGSSSSAMAATLKGCSGISEEVGVSCTTTRLTIRPRPLSCRHSTEALLPTTGTRWPRRELIPKAIGAILDYQPLLVASVIEGLVQRIGYRGLFGHIFRPFRFQSKRAPARLLVGTSPDSPPSTTLRCLPSTVVVRDNDCPVGSVVPSPGSLSPYASRSFPLLPPQLGAGRRSLVTVILNQDANLSRVLSLDILKKWQRIRTLSRCCSRLTIQLLANRTAWAISVR